MNVYDYLEKHDLIDTVRKGLIRLNLNCDRIEDVTDQLVHFQLVINYRAKSRFGQFSPSKKTIQLTSEYFSGDWDERKDDHTQTLLHEVAHLVVHFAWKQSPSQNAFGSKIQNHGREWKAVMQAFGREANRCGKSDILKEASAAKKRPAKHIYTCKKCGHEFGKQREMKNLDRRYHVKCGGRFSHQRLAA